MIKHFEIIKSKIRAFTKNLIETYSTVRELEYEKRGITLKKKGK